MQCEQHFHRPRAFHMCTFQTLSFFDKVLESICSERAVTSYHDALQLHYAQIYPFRAEGSAKHQFRTIYFSCAVQQKI